ncbi:hypothetical protein [Microbacterium sp. P05]
MSTRPRSRKRNRTHVRARAPHRQPLWLIVSAVLVAAGAIALVAAALITR